MLSPLQRRPGPDAQAGTSEIRRWLIGRERLDETRWMSAGKLSAVCIRCGNAKRHAPERCAQCGFAPRSNADLAKSFILSAAFDVGDRTIGRPADELSRIAGAISSGQQYEFSEPEVAAVAKQVAAFRAITPWNLLVSLAKWLGPPILIIAIAYLLLRST